MKIDYTLMRMPKVKIDTREASKLRGFFGNKFSGIEEMHNLKGERFAFKYPRVQYKVINEIPLICGIGEGAGIAAGVALSTNEINIEGETLDISEKEITIENAEVGTTEDYITYKFITPWLDLNQNNIEKCSGSTEEEREKLLKRILIGNILSMFKTLNYTVDKELKINLDLLKCTVNFKNIKMKVFKGAFQVNFNLPDYIGIGKSVSRGFGTIVKL